MPLPSPKQFASTTCAAVLALGLAPALAFAGENEEYRSITDQIVAQQQDELDRIAAEETIHVGANDPYAEDYPQIDLPALPASFDMRSKGWVTPVKLQKPWSTCWSFGATAASEASITSELLARIANGEDVGLSAEEAQSRRHRPFRTAYCLVCLHAPH